jgi:thiamine kinase-like enzyme
MEITAENIFDQDALESKLMSALIDRGKTLGSFRIVSRQPNIYTSTFLSEIVTLQLEDKSYLKIFCKYGGRKKYEGSKQEVDKHRASVAYEAEVYHHVLQPVQLSVPEVYGIHKGDGYNEDCLFLEFLEEAVHVNKTEPDAMAKAARWIGKFHADNETRVRQPSLKFLNVFSEEYYLSSIHRTSLFIRNSHKKKFPWFSTLCKRFERMISELSTIPVTVIHGEYYPKNIMVQNGQVRPVDWQTAAIGPGEIDLVALVDGWPDQIVDQCVNEYQCSRWPQGSPILLERTLALASVYLQFRWLGYRQELTRDESNYWRFDALHSAGEKLGLI